MQATGAERRAPRKFGGAISEFGAPWPNRAIDPVRRSFPQVGGARLFHRPATMAAAAAADQPTQVLAAALHPLGRDAWERYRARHTPYHHRPGKGGRPTSHAALAEARRLVVICQRCSAFVRKTSATRQARKACRLRYAQGDGCSSRQCAAGIFHKGRFENWQDKAGLGVASGALALIAWPSDIHDKARTPIAPPDAVRRRSRDQRSCADETSDE